ELVASQITSHMKNRFIYWPILDKNLWLPKLVTTRFEIIIHHSALSKLQCNDSCRRLAVARFLNRFGPFDLTHFSRMTSFSESGPGVDHVSTQTDFLWAE